MSDSDASDGQRGTKPPTLRDVAARVRVDPSVVSRVLNGEPTLRISPATRTRILEAVGELGYRPNAMARGLRLARTSTIGFVLPEVTNPVYGPIIEGAQARASRAGYVIVLGASSDAEEAEASFARLLSEGRVDGLLVASATLEDRVIRGLATARAPVIVVNRRVEGFIGSVVVDDEAGSRRATQHLIDLGHRRIAHVAGPGRVDTTVRRRLGYEATIEQAGIAPIVVAADGWDVDAGYRAGLRLFSELPDITGAFVANVMAAVGVMRAARESGREIPGDVSIIALHDLPLAAYLEPPLTTVTMPLRQLGEAAVELLLARLAGSRPEDRIVPTIPELILRLSTAPPRA